MNPYMAEWKEMPAGYYADPAIKAQYDEARIEAQREARQMAHDAGLERDPWTGDQVCAACNVPVEPTGEGLAVECRTCGQVWDSEHPNGHFPDE